MRRSKRRFAKQNVLLLLWSAWFTLYPSIAANAQGIGPPRGTEVLLWLFIAAATVIVLVVSTVLFLVGKKVLFKGRQLSRLEKLVLFAASILTSCAAGALALFVFDIR